MGDNTSIEWTDASWTPIRAVTLFDDAKAEATGDLGGRVGWHCEHVSEGCRNCYAESMNLRLGTGLPFKPGHRKDLQIYLDEKLLAQPLRWRRPRRIFVCSMTDLFADFVPDTLIDRMFAVMALAPHHTFQILTKRPGRMRDYMTRLVQGPWAGRVTVVGDDGVPKPGTDVEFRLRSVICDTFRITPAKALNAASDWQEKHYPEGDGFLRAWPLPNVWLGTSIEDQAAADLRMPDLLATPAAIRFLSCEPLLGPVSLRCLRYLDGPHVQHHDALTGFSSDTPAGWRKDSFNRDPISRGRIHQVIVGGESGRRARPMHPDWARDLRDQCAAADVPFLFKQWGEWAPGEIAADHLDPEKSYDGLSFDSDRWSVQSSAPGSHIDDEPDVYRVGKGKAGRMLDGVEHNGFPDGRL